VLDRLIVPILGAVDLDPCSNRWSIVPAPVAWRRGALERPWFGRVYMNNPYSKNGRWVKKCAAELEAGHVVAILALMPAAPTTVWWLDALRTVAASAMLRGRITFGGASQGAMFGSGLLLWTHDAATTERFMFAVRSWGGTCAVRIRGGAFRQHVFAGVAA